MTGLQPCIFVPCLCHVALHFSCFVATLIVSYMYLYNVIDATMPLLYMWLCLCIHHPALLVTRRYCAALPLLYQIASVVWHCHHHDAFMMPSFYHCACHCQVALALSYRVTSVMLGCHSRDSLSLSCCLPLSYNPA